MTFTLRFQKSWDAKTVMCGSESILDVLSRRSEQSPSHIHQTGVDGLDHSEKSQTARPALSKVLYSNAISGRRKYSELKVTVSFQNRLENLAYFLVRLWTHCRSVLMAFPWPLGATVGFLSSEGVLEWDVSESELVGMDDRLEEDGN